LKRPNMSAKWAGMVRPNTDAALLRICEACIWGNEKRTRNGNAYFRITRASIERSREKPWRRLMVGR
jgi:hypothetical protein